MYLNGQTTSHILLRRSCLLCQTHTVSSRLTHHLMVEFYVKEVGKSSVADTCGLKTNVFFARLQLSSSSLDSMWQTCAKTQGLGISALGLHFIHYHNLSLWWAALALCKIGQWKRVREAAVVVQLCIGNPGKMGLVPLASAALALTRTRCSWIRPL